MSTETIYGIASKIDKRDRNQRGRTRKGFPITENLTPIPFKNEVGFRKVMPEELASLLVPTAHRTSRGYEGYQRGIKPAHAFNIAWAMEDGDEIPNIQVSLDEFGRAYITDGQHRVLAAIIANKPLEVRVRERSAEDARKLFANQTFAKRVDKSHMVLVAEDKMALYVQDALVNTVHPWHKMVHETNSNKIQPSVMHRQVTMFGCNVIGSMTADYIDRVQTQFDIGRADDLARLLGVFGTDANGGFDRRNCPDAFRQTNLGALTQAAVHILIRADNIHPGPDRERWLRHMAQFNWAQNRDIRNQRKMVIALLDHWNKRLQPNRQVERRLRD